MKAERRRARAERDEAIDDAVTGHIEKLSKIMGQLVQQAGGEQYRCPQCGLFGPKVPKLGLKEPPDVQRLLLTPTLAYLGMAPASERSWIAYDFWGDRTVEVSFDGGTLVIPSRGGTVVLHPTGSH